MSSKDVNIDMIHQEIIETERYLDNNKNDYNSKQFSSSARSRTNSPSIDSKRRADILKKFGRKPIDSKFSTGGKKSPRISGESSPKQSPVKTKINEVTFSSTSSNSSSSNSNSNVSSNKASSVRMKHSSQQVKHMEDDVQSEDSMDQEKPRLNSSSLSKLNVSNKSRYADPMEREQLINRLLAMADQNHKTNVSSTSNQQLSASSDELLFASDIGPTRTSYNDIKTRHPLENLSYSNILPNKESITIENNQYRSSSSPTPIELSNKVSDIPTNSSKVMKSTTPLRYRSISPATKQKKYLKSKEQIQKEAEEEFKKVHNFHPTIYSRLSSPSQSQGSSPKSAAAAAATTTGMDALTSSGEIKRVEDQLQEEYVYGYSRRNGRIKDRIDEMLQQYEKSLRQRELQRREEQNFEMLECTFTPSITKKAEQLASQRHSRSSSPNPEIAVVETTSRLHDDALKRIEQQKWLNKHVEEARAKQYTFHPVINPVSIVMISKPKSSKSERIQELFNKYTNRGEVDGPRDISSSHKPIYERVAELQKQRYRKMNELKAEVEEHTLQDMTFKPSINPISKQLADRKLRRSLSTLEDEIRRDKGWRRDPKVPNNNIGSISNNTSTEQTMPSSHHQSLYRPLSSRRSTDSPISGAVNTTVTHASNNLPSEEEKSYEYRIGSDQTKGKLDIGTRLQLEGKIQSRNLLRLQEKYEEEEYQRIQASKYQKPITSLSPESQENSSASASDFNERQKYHLQKLKLKQQRYLQQRNIEAESWFQPKILDKSKELVVEKYPERSFESTGERVNRLFHKDLQARLEAREVIRRKMNRDMTFQPKLNDMSLAIGRPSDLKELVEDSRGKVARERIKQKIEEIKSKQYSFKPKITDYYEKTMSSQSLDPRYPQRGGKDYSHVGWMECPVDEAVRTSIDDSKSRRPHTFINLKEPDRMKKAIDNYLNEKEESRQSELMSKEIQELQGCTFSPDITGFSYRYYLKDEPVIVRGLGRHLELRNMSIRMKEEAIQREREVFRVRNIQKYRRPEDGSTIIEPFHLSESFASKGDRR